MGCGASLLLNRFGTLRRYVNGINVDDYACYDVRTVLLNLENPEEFIQSECKSSVFERCSFLRRSGIQS